MPLRAFLLASNLATATESSNGARGTGVLARIPCVSTTSSMLFATETWAPLSPVFHLLHEHSVTSLHLRLLDADTHAPVVLTDARGWSVTLSVHHVHEPEAVRREHMSSQLMRARQNLRAEAESDD